MSQDQLGEMLTALCGYHKKADGSPCQSLADLLSLPEAQKAYIAAMKGNGNNGTGATMEALKALCTVRGDFTELPVHVVNPSEYVISKGADGKWAREMNEDGTEVRVCTIAMPNGYTRSLRNVPESTLSALSPGAAATLRGGGSFAMSLYPRNTVSYRINREAVLEAGGHNEPFPLSGLDFGASFGEYAKKNNKGAFYVGKRGVATLTFGAKRDTDFPFYAAGTVAEARYSDFGDTPIVKLKVEDAAGNIVAVKRPTSEIANVFGINGDDNVAFEPLVGEPVLMAGNGAITYPKDPHEFGDGAFEAALQELEAGGLISTNPYTKRRQLSINDAAVRSFKDNGEVPHIMIGDTRVVDIEEQKDGTWSVQILASDAAGTPWMDCNPHPWSNENGEGVANPTGMFVWLNHVGGTRTYNEGDPIYAALKNIDLPDIGQQATV